MYKYVNQLFIKYNVLVIRIFTVVSNQLKFKFICMGMDGIYSLYSNDIIATCRSVFVCALRKLIKLTVGQSGYIPIPDNTAHIKEHLQSLENGQLIVEKLQALKTKPDEIIKESTFKSILTPKNANKVNELWDSLNHQYQINYPL